MQRAVRLGPTALSAVMSPDVELNGHDDWVFDVRFSADGRFVLSGSVDKTARLWDIRPGNVIRDFERVHQTPVSSLEIGKSGKPRNSALPAAKSSRHARHCARCSSTATTRLPSSTSLTSVYR